jgi:hypothetical protein
MAKITIHRLRPKPTAAGTRWYWEPSATLKRAGWKPLALGLDEAAAIRAAQARNVEVKAWREGGATPRQIARIARRATVGALIVRYRAERMPQLGLATRKLYAVALDRIDRWAGDTQAAAITRRNVRDLRDTMMAGREIGHHAAHSTLKVLRTLFEWAKNQEVVPSNPAAAFDLAAPAPRYQIWADDDFAAFAAAAVAQGHPAMAYAVELAAWIGQREADLIRLTERQWKEMPPLDRALHDALAGADGRVMAIELRQAKTNRWIAVPLAGAIRADTEAAIAANRRRGVGTVALLTNDTTGLPWQQRNFIRVFNQVRDRAVADGHGALSALQFRDLRRTCVVRLGRLGLNDAQISAITGHQLETTKRILETYMPRDHVMAASAIVATLARPGKNVGIPTPAMSERKLS